ncbi:hypothetical protein CYMTET_13603 [Cymbomonas tetramitiformis]|uniref:Uncharacterized protein n=1 Tax=Cymbomonas tetramitiformis TaxID=36881 RepID=A0AAE0LAW7_9CHLO|nr:hypothetical protein CYMTET_13603 [Cymbomonas tetramitiformis]
MRRRANSSDQNGMPEEWDGDFSENLDENILPSNLPTNSDETDFDLYYELDESASQASDSPFSSEHPSEEGLWFGQEQTESVWWTELEQVYVIGFVDADDQPLGLYANRAEIDGSWWDVIVGWEGLEDAERHSGLVEATMEAEVGIVLQVVEPTALQTAASNAEPQRGEACGDPSQSHNAGRPAVTPARATTRGGLR